MRKRIGTLSLLLLTSCLPEKEDHALEHNTKGDIVIIGNNGGEIQIVGDVVSATGAIVSTVIGAEQNSPLVINKITGEEIPSRIDGYVRTEGHAPLVKLARLDSDVPAHEICEVYEEIENGELRCREDLNDITFSSTQAPKYLESGELVALNKQAELVLLNNPGEVQILATDVESFYIDARQNIFYRQNKKSNPVFRLVRDSASGYHSELVVQGDYVRLWQDRAHS